jgi:hypothetical protein
MCDYIKLHLYNFEKKKKKKQQQKEHAKQGSPGTYKGRKDN